MTKLLFAGPTLEQQAKKTERARSAYGHVKDFQHLWNLWNRIERRQNIWKAVKEAVAKMAEFEWTHEQAAAVLRACETGIETVDGQAVSRHSANRVDPAEIATFGRTMTSGVPAERLQFWLFLQLVRKGITPSDLLMEHDVAQQMNEAMAKAQEIQALPELTADGANQRMRLLRENRFGNLERPTYIRHIAKTIRTYANLYLNAGHSPADVCHYVPGSAGYLTKPNDARLGAPEDKSLEYWRQYGIDSLADLPAYRLLAEPKVYEPQVRKIVKMAAEEIGSADSRGLIALQVKQLMKNLPVSQWPMVYLLSTRTYVLGMARWAPGKDVYEWMEKELDKLEELHFGALVTQGNFLVRLQFWKFAGHHEEVMNLHRASSGEILRTCAKALVAEGVNPTWLAMHRADGGRGGLTHPISPDRFSFVEDKYKYLYLPLHRWMEVEDGVGSLSGVTL